MHIRLLNGLYRVDVNQLFLNKRFQITPIPFVAWALWIMHSLLALSPNLFLNLVSIYIKSILIFFMDSVLTMKSIIHCDYFLAGKKKKEVPKKGE